MRGSLRRSVLCGLGGLLAATACTDTSCGGCLTPLSEPFPEEPRVYDGVQVRVTDTGWSFVEQELPAILGSLLEDGLTFEIPPSDFSFIGIDGTICQTLCPITIEILDSDLNLVPPDRITLDAHVNTDGAITIDANILGHCEFPLLLQNKPISAEVLLRVDPVTHFFHFEVGNLELTIEDDDYDIVCGPLWDALLEWIKPFLTGILNLSLQAQLGGAIDGLIAQQTCVTCDFYTAGCPAGSTCNQDGYCESGGACVVRPLGLVGILELGELLADIDPTSQATLDMLVALGQLQQPSQSPFVRNGGLEVRLIGGTYSDQDGCTPTPDPADVPPTGAAPSMLFDNVIPGSGDSFMVGVAIADMFLDHFFYQLWRSGMLCLSIDSYGLPQISSKTLALFIPSLDLITDGENAPARLSLRPRGVPSMEVGAGTFLPDGTMDEPILYLLLPQLGMDFWVKVQGRWVRFLTLFQDVKVRLGIEFTPDNKVVPILDEDSVEVTNAVASNYELLAEDPVQLEGLVPQLLGMFLPLLTGVMGDIEIPDLQGFVLDVKSVRGDVPRGGTDFYEFMAIYADLGFVPSPPTAAQTRVQLERAGSTGFVLQVLDPGSEVQYRLDSGVWSSFRPGPVVAVRRSLLPGEHELEVRARNAGDYKSLDPTPECLAFDVAWPTHTPAPATGCTSVPGRGLSLAALVLMGLALVVRRFVP